MDLFTNIDEIKIEAISQFDIELQTPKYMLFLDVLKFHEESYPDIIKWFKTKVVPGLKNKSRMVYLGLVNDLPIATSVVKIGNPSKFCHLHIKSEYQNSHIGEFFFVMMALDVKRSAKNIYFTLPESLWETKSIFFKSFGFDTVEKHTTQYRNGDAELITSASFQYVWEKSLQKLPKLIEKHTDSTESIFNGLLMSIKPQFSKLIFGKTKVVEIRKKFNTIYSGSRVTFYSSFPRKELVGSARIRNVISDNPKTIWDKYGNLIASTKVEYNSYVGDSKNVYAIFLDDPKEYKYKIPLSQINFWLDSEIQIPQSYLNLNGHLEWQKALSISQILQRRFTSYTKKI